jgi:hypothetical protein
MQVAHCHEKARVGVAGYDRGRNILPDLTAQPTEPVTDSPSEHTEHAGATPERPTRAQRLSAYAFLFAFGATILTVILTGLWVRSPASRGVPQNQVVVLAVAQPHTVNLLFTSQARFDEVEFTLDLPPGIELTDRPGVRRLDWRAPLAAGNNLLPLMLVARRGQGGELAARLKHGGAQKTFVVDLKVGAR